MRRRSRAENPGETDNRPAYDRTKSIAGGAETAFSFPGILLKKWPVDDKGDPEPPVFLTHRSGSNLDDETLVAMFDAYGIPCLRRYPSDGDFGRLVFGVPASGVDIFVPASMHNDATALLEGESDDENSTHRP
ncbi:MAG: hypothetical protein FWG32_07385 [Oscillospiraceae bacterium]|nr:hypothetical protein [Oscillospiraceae bacterium]